MGVTFILMLAAFFQRVIALPAAPRLLGLAVVLASRVSWLPFEGVDPVRGVHHPYDVLAVAAAFITGELVLGHPFELRWRAAFAREVWHAGRVPDPAINAAALRMVHPLTLRFSNGELERAYATRKFPESYPMLLASCLVLAFLFVLHAAAYPMLRHLSFCGMAIVLGLLGIRRVLHNMSDQARANALFSWGTCLVVALPSALLTGAQHRYMMVEQMGVQAFAVILTLHGVGMLLLRFVAVGQVPRMMVLVTVAIVIALWPSGMSEIGKPQEALLSTAALLTGELMSHPFELRRRAAFAREALASGRVPDPAIDAAGLRLVHPVTLRFSNGELERAYAVRSFGEGYHIVVAFCTLQLALSCLLTISEPDAMYMTASVGLAVLIILAARTGLRRVSDPELAASTFAWGWFMVWTLVWAGICYERRRIFLAGGTMSCRALLGHAALGVVLGVFQRFMALPMAPRILVLAVGSALSMNFMPPVVGLDVSRAGLFIVAAQVLGDLGGHPVELRRRAAFAREVVRDGFLPDAAEDAAVVSLLHSLTLSFSDGTTERAWAAHSFSERYPLVLGVLSAGGAVMAVATLTLSSTTDLENGARLCGWAMVMLGLLCAARISLSYAPDQSRARLYFSWIWCVAWGLFAIAAHAMERRIECYGSGAMRCIESTYVIVHKEMWSYSWRLAMAGGLGHLSFALAQRLLFELSFAPRVLTLVAITTSHCLFIDPLGISDRLVFVAGALIAGEMLAYPAEHQRRLAYLAVAGRRSRLAEVTA